MRVEDFFTRKEYERLYKDNLICGLLVAIWGLPVFLVDENDVVDIVTTNIAEVNFGSNNIAKVRIREIVNEFIQWGYL